MRHDVNSVAIVLGLMEELRNSMRILILCRQVLAEEEGKGSKRFRRGGEVLKWSLWRRGRDFAGRKVM